MTPSRHHDFLCDLLLGATSALLSCSAAELVNSSMTQFGDQPIAS